MGLFDKKYCDFCGEQIGLLSGHYNLADGKMCKTCMKELSPWLIRKKEYTVMDMQAYLDSRKYNRQLLEAFQPSRVVGTNWKVFMDDAQGMFCLSRDGDYRADNTDIFYMSQIVGCDMEIKEEEHRIAQTPPPPEPPCPEPTPPRPEPVPRPRQTPPHPEPVPPRPRQTPPRPESVPRPRQTPPPAPGGTRREEPMDRGMMEGPSGRGRAGGPSDRGMMEGPSGRGRAGGPSDRGMMEGPSGRGRSEAPSDRRRSEGPSGGRGSKGGPGGRGPARPAPVPPNPQIVVPMYYYTYDYYIHLYLNHDWIPSVTFKINSMEITEKDKPLRRRMEAELTELRDTLLALKTQAAQYTAASLNTASQTTTETAAGEVTCQYCGSVTVPDTDGCCTNCGKYIGQ